MAMRALLLCSIVVACGGGKPTPVTPDNKGSADAGVVRDTRSEIEKRRDTACEQLAPRLFDCAVTDAKAEQAAGKITKAQLDQLTTPEMREAHKKDFLKGCHVDMSSRQVRVLEVCLKEEPECGPLADCLTHLDGAAGK